MTKRNKHQQWRVVQSEPYRELWCGEYKTLKAARTELAEMQHEIKAAKSSYRFAKVWIQPLFP